MSDKEEGKRQKILNAARQVLGEKEIHETLMDEIANRAGVAKGTLYLYFQSKEDLFKGLFQQTLSNLVIRVGESVKGKLSGKETLKAVFRCQAEFLDEHKDFIAHVMMRQAPPFSGPQKKIFASGFKEVFELTDRAVEQSIQEGELKKCPARQVSITLFAHIRGFFLAHLIGLSQRSLSDEIPWMWQVFWRGIGGKEE